MHTVENPVRTVFYPQRTDPFVINTSPPPVATLYDSFRVTDVSAAESVSKIWSFMHSPSKIAAARNLRGEEAQALIDLIDQVSDVRFQHDGARGTELGVQALGLPELVGNLRKQCLHLLYKVCKACELLPTSYVLRQAFMRVGKVRCCSGFADVSEGEYLGRRVAIKHLRFGTEDAFNKVFKVQVVIYLIAYRRSVCIQRFCREIISWKHLFHPNILPLLGVSVSTGPRGFRIVSYWMQNGDVMRYTRTNPKANRLRLVSPLAISSRVPTLFLITFSSLRSCLAQLTFTISGSFMGTLKGYYRSFGTRLCLTDRLSRQISSLTTTVLLVLQTLVS